MGLSLSIRGLFGGRYVGMKHINTQDHASGLKFSRFSPDILELVEKYRVEAEESMDKQTELDFSEGQSAN